MREFLVKKGSLEVMTNLPKTGDRTGTYVMISKYRDLYVFTKQEMYTLLKRIRGYVTEDDRQLSLQEISSLVYRSQIKKNNKNKKKPIELK
jgi:thiamine biosynthesis lipoprotein ApbE